MSAPTAVDRLCIDTLRALSIDAVQRASSGHPGLPLGAAPMAYVLWSRHLCFDPADPSWPDRDRFVLSAGHGSMLLYSLLHVFGYDLPMAELMRFRQWESRTPGHPEFRHTPGVECTTGPLGQGAANAVGMALAERWLAQRYGRPGHAVVDHRTYALLGDGDMMEGLCYEAASLAGHLGLGKLTFLYDANDVSLDGPLDMAFSEDVGRRFEACGWSVFRVADGDRDLAAIDAALRAARADLERPSLVIVKTTIGFGSPGKAGTSEAHGAPLGVEEVARTKAALGWEYPPFHVPEEARARCAARAAEGAAARAAWERRFAAYERAHPELAAEWRRAQAGLLPDGWDAGIPAFEAGKMVATRSAGAKVMNAVAAGVPWLVGGDADLSCSTKTRLSGTGDLSGRGDGAGRNVRFGVREHAMASVANGMAYHGGVRPYTATFFVFSDYMRPGLRLAAMNRLPVVHVFTHDSVAVGEDGPTHQPIEHLMSLRAMPGYHVVRPCDAAETAEAWRYAMRRGGGPTALVLSRQDLPVLDRNALGPAEGLSRGAYVLADAPHGAPTAILIATGSEVHVALAARERLAAEGIAARVVSMPCFETFAAQDEAYRDLVLPPSVAARVSIEAGATFGWEHWIGARGVALGIDRYGASAPGGEALERLGMTVDRAVAAVRTLLGARVDAPAADILHDFPIAVPADRVFRAVSTPEGLDRWWTKRSSGSPSNGGEYELWFGPEYDWRAKVTRCDPNREFELELVRSDADWLGTRVGFRLEDRGESTFVRFHHTGWPVANEHYRISCNCWAMYLRVLRRHLEHGEEVPYERRLDA